MYGNVTSLAFTRDGRSLLSTHAIDVQDSGESRGECAIMWDVASGGIVQSFEAPELANGDHECVGGALLG